MAKKKATPKPPRMQKRDEKVKAPKGSSGSKGSGSAKGMAYGC